MRKRNENKCIAHSECLNLLFPAEKFSFYVLLTNYMEQVAVSFLEEKPAFQVVVHQLKSSSLCAKTRRK